MKKLIVLMFILAAATCFAADKSKEEMWMEAPSLGIMPHMIANVTKDVPKWDEGLGDKFDAEEWVTAFKDVGASYMYVIAKWHDGFCFWDTDTTSYKSKNDYVGQLIKASHKHGLRFTFYFNHHTEGNPEWEHTQLHHLDGRPYRKGFQFAKHSVHTDFRQFTLSQIRELLTKYGRVDGIWLDHFAELTDVSDKPVHEAFEKMFGYPLKDADLHKKREFSARSLGSYLLDVKDVAAEAGQNSFLITMNGGLRYSSPGDSYTKFIASYIDYPSQEGHYIPRLENRVRRGGLIAKPIDIGVKFNSSWHVVPNKENPLILNREQAIAISSMAVFHGSSLWLALIPDYDGAFGENLKLAKEVGKWFKRTRPYLEGVESFRDVGIVMGKPDFYCTRSMDMPNTHWRPYSLQRKNGLDEVIMQINALREAGFASDMISQWWDGTGTWPNDLSCYRALVIPEGAILDQTAADELRAYVRNGGKVIGFAHSGSLDEYGNKQSKFMLEDLFGVKVGKQIKLPADLTMGFVDVDVSSSALLDAGKCIPPIVADIKPTTAKVLASLDYGDRPPVVFRNRFGKGEAIMLATTDGACRSNPALWSALLTMTGSGDPTFNVPVDHNRFAVLMNRVDKGVTFHVVDREGGAEGVVPEEISVVIDAARFGEVTKISAIESGDAKDLKRKGSKVMFTIKPSPSSTVLFEVPGGKPEADARRRTVPSSDWLAAIANPLKVLKPAKQRESLTAQEREALRIQIKKETEDVNLELNGK